MAEPIVVLDPQGTQPAAATSGAEGTAANTPQPVFVYEDLVVAPEPPPATGEQSPAYLQMKAQMEEVTRRGQQWEQYANTLAAQGQRPPATTAATSDVPEGVEDPHVAGLYRQNAALLRQMQSMRADMGRALEGTKRDLRVEMSTREIDREVPTAIAAANEGGALWVSEAEVIRTMQGNLGLSPAEAAAAVKVARMRSFKEQGLVLRKEKAAPEVPGFRRESGGMRFEAPTKPKSFDDVQAAIRQAVAKMTEGD